MCKCGEISVDGGDAMRCAAKDWSNFVRVDDNGNEIAVRIKDDTNVKPLDIPKAKPTKKELLAMLDEMISNIEKLPQEAMLMPITHYDFVSSLLLLSEIAKSAD